MRKISKVAVLGAGTMGSGIACHFANIGCEVLLLDIPFKDETSKLDKNKIVNSSFQNSIKQNPSPLFEKSFAKRIQIGNFEDDLSKIKEYEWIIEVVSENYKIKQELYEKVEKYRTLGTLITTNTSGIPMSILIQGRSDDFKQHFCGTHFFNPPRYLQLFEIIPCDFTKKEVLEFINYFGSHYLGKQTILCKDTPGFIGNRIGVYSLNSTLHATLKFNFSISKVDELTGKIIGRAKSGTFRTLDVIGLDVGLNVSENLYNACKDDKRISTFSVPEFLKKIIEKKWLGNKTKQGFYKKVKTESESEIFELNLKTLEYEKTSKLDIPELKEAKKHTNDLDKIKHLFNAEGQIGDFYRWIFCDLFSYCSLKVPEISDEIYKIDQAICAGYAWKYGPFEIWDHIGIEEVIKVMEKLNLKPVDWVYEIVKSKQKFYEIKNSVQNYIDINSKKFIPLPEAEKFITLKTIKNSIVWKNDSATLYDFGDGIVNLEIHTKMNSIDDKVLSSVNKAIDTAEKDFRGLIIGNEDDIFSAGANLALLYATALEQDFDSINMIIDFFQKTSMRLRYSKIPTVAALSGLALGGACEFAMHCDARQVHCETYIGLVEVGAGLIPAGAGTKEAMLLASNSYKVNDPELNVIQEYFTNIAMAKVSTSAYEAININYVKKHDSITINRRHLLSDAKNKALELSKNYIKPISQDKIKVHGRSGLAFFQMLIANMLHGKYITEYDAFIGNKLAYVMCGGDLSAETFVNEQYLLDLEREAFLSLCGEKKSLERVHSIIFKRKPLRN